MSDLLEFVFSHTNQFRRARLPSLYSDFSLQRYSNPDGFAANTTAWLEVLGKAARAGMIPSSGGAPHVLSLNTGEDLLRSLNTKEWGRPLALGTVIDDAVAHHHLMPYNEFLAARKNVYSRKWAVQPWWLLSWGLTQLGLRDTSSTTRTLPSGRFVILQNVEEAASTIVEQMSVQRSQAGAIYPMSIFKKEAAQAMNLRDSLTDSDLNVVLTHLARDTGAIVYDQSTVKFREPGSSHAQLTTQDITIASLKALIVDLREQIAMLTSRMSTLSEDIQKAVDKKNRVSALAAIKSRKLSERILAQRSETVSQLEDVYGKIEQAADQVAIVRVMEASTKVLQNLHTEAGGVEKTEDVVESLREQMNKVDEIDSILGTAGQESQQVHEDDVEEELEEMLEQAESQREKHEATLTQQRLAGIDSNIERGRLQDTDSADKSRATAMSAEKPEDHQVNEELIALKRLSLDAGPTASFDQTSQKKQDVQSEPLPGP